MRSIAASQFKIGKMGFTPPKFDENGNIKRGQFLTWHFELDGRNASVHSDPLTYLQGYKCAVRITAVGEAAGSWFGHCAVGKYDMIPNAAPGQPSILKGQLEFHEIPEKILSLQDLLVMSLKHKEQFVEVDIEVFQPELAPTS